jgi:hypothetical protein
VAHHRIASGLSIALSVDNEDGPLFRIRASRGLERHLSAQARAADRIERSVYAGIIEATNVQEQATGERVTLDRLQASGDRLCCEAARYVGLDVLLGA